MNDFTRGVLKMSSRMNNKGQNVIEYMLIFAVVATVVLIAFAPRGIVQNTLNQSLERSVDFVQEMAEDVDYSDEAK